MFGPIFSCDAMRLLAYLIAISCLKQSDLKSGNSYPFGMKMLSNLFELFYLNSRNLEDISKVTDCFQFQGPLWWGHLNYCFLKYLSSPKHQQLQFFILPYLSFICPLPHLMVLEALMHHLDSINLDFWHSFH